MIYSTATVPVNPGGEAPLTREQVWAGLELKARDAREFLPPGLCTRCDVTEESPTHFVRDATIGGTDLREIITFEPGRKVTFFQATGPREGAIVNEIIEALPGRGANINRNALILLAVLRNARQCLPGVIPDIGTPCRGGLNQTLDLRRGAIRFGEVQADRFDVRVSQCFFHGLAAKQRHQAVKIGLAGRIVACQGILRTIIHRRIVALAPDSSHRTIDRPQFDEPCRTAL